MAQKILEIKNIHKNFGVVQVLDDVSLDIFEGEILALSGENGAGKSTLMKIVAGLYPPTQGEIYFKGTLFSHYTLPYAKSIGISLIYQELSIAPNITVMENIFMGNEKSRYGLLRKEEMNNKASDILKLLNADFTTTQKAGHLSIAQQQQVEIARAISHNSELIIMDEPTASLSEREVEKLFDLIQSLKKKGITIIYISHKMDEIQKIADRVAILRDGKYIGDSSLDDLDNIIYMMVGRSIDSFYVELEDNNLHQSSKYTNSNTTLKFDNISDTQGLVKHISCELVSGKIIGVSGLVGAGRSELARLLFGADKIAEGKIFLDGKEIHIRNPRDAIALGIGMVPEDRKLQGLFLEMTSLENLIENNQIEHAHYKFILDKKKNKKLAEKSIENFNIKTTLQKKPKMLSGGNQQKVLLSRWMNINPRILIFDEPTRGVDVGAKQEIYKAIRKIAHQNTLVIFISSELPEIIHLSDRVLVMKDGYLVGDIIEKSKITQENIMKLCTQ